MRRHHLGVLALLLCVSTLQAAPCTGTPADCVEVTINVDGFPRVYQYHVPQGASCPSNNLPVVMFLHGGTGNANNARSDIGYANSAGTATWW